MPVVTVFPIADFNSYQTKSKVHVVVSIPTTKRQVEKLYLFNIDIVENSPIN